MTEETKHTLDELAELIKEKIQKRNLTAETVSKESGINKQQLYSVLRMGNPKRPNYSIETLIRLINYLSLSIDLKKTSKKG